MKELAEQLFSLRFSHTRSMSRILEAAATGGEDGVLLWLLGNGGTALAGDLARALQLTSGRIANILKQLESRKYVERQSGADDRRKVKVTLTPEGEEYITRVRDEEVEKYEKVLDLVGEDDAREFIRISEEVLEKLDERDR